jgi:hypothetical protein
MASSDLRRAYLDVLMEQVRSPRYPSVGMLDRIEMAVADREAAEEYVQALIENIAMDRYPSPTMLDRVRGLLDALDG